MKKYHYWLQRKLKYIIWSLILLSSVYLLIRFAVISFSEDIGQATGEMEETCISKLSVHIMEAGSGLISYTNSEKDIYGFPLNFVDNKFAVIHFLGHDTKVMAQETQNTMQHGFIYNSETEQINGATMEEPESRIGFQRLPSSILTKEYILTNGSLKMPGEEALNIDDEVKIDILEGDITALENADAGHVYDGLTVETFVANDGTRFTIDQLKDLNFLIRHFYIVDKTTKVTEPLFDVEAFLEKDLTMKQTNEEPQILIYHTHGSEAFKDSRPGVEEDTVIGIGNYLESILEEKYGYNVLHDKTAYDTIVNKDSRNLAYNYANKALQETLNKYPSIEVLIDLHRNSGDAVTTTINGKETAQIMLFNGLSRDQNGPLPNHDNPYLQDNLAFSFQLQLKSLDLYPGLFMRNYLKCYRYNLHFRPKSLLVELGTVNNTVEQARNAMEPFAEVLDAVLKGK